MQTNITMSLGLVLVLAPSVTATMLGLGVFTVHHDISHNDMCTLDNPTTKGYLVQNIG